jgi:hypothetical protein
VLGLEGSNPNGLVAQGLKQRVGVGARARLDQKLDLGASHRGSAEDALVLHLDDVARCVGDQLRHLRQVPSWDHVKHEDGAVAEIEVGFYFGERHGRTHQAWRTWLMGGSRVAGPSGVSGTYNTRLELGLARTF